MLPAAECEILLCLRIKVNIVKERNLNPKRRTGRKKEGTYPVRSEYGGRMKVVQRGSMKVLPGRMPEAMELMKKHMEIVERLGMNPSEMRSYRPVYGDEIMHTVVFEYSWDSFAQFAEFMERMMEDKEMLDLIAKWSSVLESHSAEILSPMG